MRRETKRRTKKPRATRARRAAVPAPHFTISAGDSVPVKAIASPEESGPQLPSEFGTIAGLHLQSANPEKLLRNVQELLTPREREVLAAFVRSPRNKVVAGLLGTTEQTVRNQMTSIRRKLGAATPIELVSKVLVTLCWHELRADGPTSG